MFLFFFFKQKTSYEMRISDWSSDVCSSDLSRWGLQTCLSRSTLAVSGKTCSEWSVIRMSLGQQLQPHLPFLRRYGRALTGSQTHGDAYVRATLEAIVAAPEQFPREIDPRLGLYRTFHAIWGSANIDDGRQSSDSDVAPHEQVARARLSRITPLSRQALLLTAMEGFTPEDTAYLIGTSESAVSDLVQDALRELEAQTRAKVLSIEDEQIITMDLETTVRERGPEVTAVALNRHEAGREGWEDNREQRRER